MNRIRSLAPALLLLGALSSCASAPPPVEKMEASQAAIRAAEELGAPKVPQAALHLQLAKEQSMAAKASLSQGERARAEGLLMRAAADAELALALARESSARSEAQQAIDRIRALKHGEP
jgi:hypothetical protein